MTTSSQMPVRDQQYCGTWLFHRSGDADHLYRAAPIGTERVVRALQSLDVLPFTMDEGRTYAHGVPCIFVKMRRLPFQIRITEMAPPQVLDTLRYLVDLARAMRQLNLAMPGLGEDSVLWWDRPWFVGLGAVLPWNRQTARATFLRISRLFYIYARRRPIRSEFTQENLKKQGGWPALKWDGNVESDVFWQDFRKFLDAPPLPMVSLEPEPETSQEVLDQVAEVLPSMPAGRTFLDFTCGIGQVTSMAAQKYPSVCGVDPRPAMVCEAPSAPGVNYATFGVRQLFADPKSPGVTRFKADVVSVLEPGTWRRLGIQDDFLCDVIAMLTDGWVLVAKGKNMGRHLRRRGLKREPGNGPLDLWRLKTIPTIEAVDDVLS